ncbi:hypothetical protein [Sphingobacterium sp. MYb388]|uniref:hypothetical protein n=1 Tax=Sphingobacterium sp. MYb388 TaxID=2745437 RepID=UPI00309BEC90
MKSNKLKIGFAAMAFALIGAGFTSAQADEFWRPDKEDPSATQIQLNQCTTSNPNLCATRYANGSDLPIAEIHAVFVP